MLYKDDEIPKDGISIDDLDDEAIEDAIRGKKLEDDEETPDDPSKSNNVNEKEEPSQEGEGIPDEKIEVPFHKHPRFREIIEKTHKLSEDLELANKTIEELKNSKKENEGEEMAGWFGELYGDSEETKTAWKIYKTQSLKDREETKREILAEIEARNSAVVQEEARWNNWVDGEISRLQDEGEKFDVNKLKKVMVDYRPTTEDGKSLDFDKGLELYKKLYGSNEDKDKNKIRKQIADTTTTKANKSDSGYMTPGSLRHKSFSTLAEEGE